MPTSVFKPPYLIESSEGINDNGDDIGNVYPNH